MHELSIATNLVDTAVRSAEEAGARSVTRLHLRLGALAGVEPEALTFCFPVVARGTICEGAELRLEIVPARGVCAKCREQSEVRDLLAPCPACGEWPLAVEGGRELRLESLEVT